MKEEIKKIIKQRTDAVNELMKMDGVPFDYLTAVSLISIGMGAIESIKGKEHLIRVMEGWTNNIKTGAKI